jgi:hypothetical protein
VSCWQAWNWRKLTRLDAMTMPGSVDPELVPIRTIVEPIVPTEEDVVA